MNQHPLGEEARTLYRSLVRERLSAHPCRDCGRTLEGATVTGTRGGTTLDEWDLSELALVQVLATTEVISVLCVGCGSSQSIGETFIPVRKAPRPMPQGSFLEPAARELYHQLILERLAGSTCPRCHHVLADAEVLRATGGTNLDDYGLSDMGVARTLAATQRLQVRCPGCAKHVTL